MRIQQNQYRSPHSSGEKAGETISPLILILLCRTRRYRLLFVRLGQVRYWLTPLGDQHSLSLGLNFVHDFQAMDFELSAAIVFIGESFRSWSLYHGHPIALYAEGRGFPLSRT